MYSGVSNIVGVGVVVVDDDEVDDDVIGCGVVGGGVDRVCVVIAGVVVWPMTHEPVTATVVTTI